VRRAVIFHTSDLHNHLSAAAARQLAELRRAHPGAFLFDSGDAVAAGNLSFRPAGEPILLRMAEAGYDAMAMGNRESHPKAAALAQKLKDASFPVLSANLRPTGARHAVPLPVRAHVVLERAGLRVAVFGLTPQMTRPNSLWAKVTDYVFEDPVVTARRVSAELRAQADLVICLSHCGLGVDRNLTAIETIDLVLGGHTHREVIEQQSGGAMLVHPGAYGRRVSRTEISSRGEARSELLALEAEA
jgi:2',3'-cyclic-nucleotide 2'-phosphodiesterase (5'-nucleotidase family)